MEIGKETPVTEKPEPVAAMFEIFSEPLPVLDTVTICEFVTPTTTFPKLIFKN